MATIFTKIRTGEIPGYILDDTGEFFAILDINPRQPGHTLVIPHVEESSIFDLEEERYQRLWTYARQVAKNLQSLTGSARVGVIVEGFEVPHVHIHLVPINHQGDMRKRTKVSEAEMQKICQEYQKINQS